MVRDKPKLDRGLYRGVNGLWYYDIYMEGKHLRGCTWKESKTAARKWLNEFRALQGDRLIGKGPKDPAQTLKTIYEAWAKAQAEKVSAEHLNDMRVAVLVHDHTHPHINARGSRKYPTSDAGVMDSGSPMTPHLVSNSPAYWAHMYFRATRRIFHAAFQQFVQEYRRSSRSSANPWASGVHLAPVGVQ
jgi:hypothetical protein